MTMLTERATGLAYIFKGRLCGLLCADYMEPLSKVKVRLYRLENEKDITLRAVASPKDTLRILKDEEVRAKEHLLIAEVETDEDGNFAFALGEKQGYGGEAFDVDVYCGTVPHLKIGPRPPRGPVQFSITTIQPVYRQTEQAQIAAWDYCLPHRFWCAIRALFGAWTICGHVRVCDNGGPVSGVKVIAFDADWTQDDPLGSGITDASGHYRIDYLADDFKQTPPPLEWLHIELFGGPDLYFRVEDSMGNVLLNEPHSRGRASDRENVGPCAEVDLCVSRQPQTPPHVDTIPLFNQIGAYHIYTDLTSDGLTIAGKYAFTGVIPLMGIMPDGTNSEALEYRFTYRQYNPDGTIAAGSDPVTNAMIPATQIGWLEFRDWDGSAWITNSAPYYVNNPSVAPTIIRNSDGTTQSHICNVNAAPDGWIRIPRENDLSFGGIGRFVPNGTLANLNTVALTTYESFNVTGLLAGNSVPSGQQAGQHKFRLFFEARKVIGLMTVGSNVLNAIQMSNTNYAQHRHPSWGESNVSYPAVVEMDIAELISAGCGNIGGSLHALYTVYHPYLETVGLRFEGNLPPAPAVTSFDLTPAFGTAEVTSTSAGQLIDLSAFDSCAYILWLEVTLRLTSGYGQVYGTFQDHIAFCKD